MKYWKNPCIGKQGYDLPISFIETLKSLKDDYWNRPVLGPQVLWSKDDEGNTASASSDKDYQRLLLSVV